MTEPKKTKDFSEVRGRRLRISVDVYQPSNRQFRHVKGVGARITVRNAREQKQLWAVIEKAIEAGKWRLPADEPDTADDDASSPGTDRLPANP
jgi:hypothetical protein